MILKIDRIDWRDSLDILNEKGFALIPQILSHPDCEQLIRDYGSAELFRKTVSMERFRFGSGEYKYFHKPEPEMIGSIKEQFYSKLVPLANHWMELLNSDIRFPNSIGQLQELCESHGQTLSTALLLKYQTGGFNTLHQDLYGEVYFPFQLVFFLSEPEKDYTGGEFVLTQTRPRAQSKAIVLKPRKGDMLILTTNFLPVKGSKGFYKSQMRHGVSEVLSGNRYAMGVIFHDAVS
ncbi:prolyl 4-hydroxylase subunit alpha [Leptospira semungkisensis]|uniref:Prolyl 4-hydroxylase subunit alpha n=1 Tax=Leptospira semungkisensis TaxID=2484985 RepID=A0A4R9G7X6_9LEPT|nr:2OG-Fe(II) oxygenase [Leptospira semungkisensis]TGK07746.1 prolyl 4-hydroxylase subunit alpha [Leptospira semungkisensis]